MAQKIDVHELETLAEATALRIVSAPQEWAAFLDAAARLYKYDYTDQLLIYAQRPYATACAPIELWNDRRFMRWVNKGASGIALLDNAGTYPKTKYVFDVSDTNSRIKPAPQLWALREEHHLSVAQDLASSFSISELDEESYTTLEFQVLDTAQDVVSDNIAQYAQDFSAMRAGSALAALSEADAGWQFANLVRTSVARTVLSRCTLDAESYIPQDDFDGIEAFDKPELVSILGGVVSDLSEMILRRIERTVREYDLERGKENEHHLHTSGRLQTAEPDPQTVPDGGTGQIRNDAQELPVEQQEAAVWRDGAERDAPEPLAGDRQTGEGNAGELGSVAPTAEPAAADGQHDGAFTAPRDDSPSGGGNRAGGAGLQLSLGIFPEDIPTEQEQIIHIVEETEAVASVFSVSQQDLERALLGGSGIVNGKTRIYAYFVNQSSTSDRAKFLKNEYGTGGRSFDFSDGNRGFQSASPKGFELSLHYDEKVVYTWAEIAKQIGRLVDSGAYQPNGEYLYISLPELASGHRTYSVGSGFQYEGNHYTIDHMDLEAQEISAHRANDEVDTITMSTDDFTAFIVNDVRDNATTLKAHGFLADYEQGNSAVVDNPEARELAIGDVVYLEGTTRHVIDGVSTTRQTITLYEEQFPIITCTLPMDGFLDIVQANHLNGAILGITGIAEAEIQDAILPDETPQEQTEKEQASHERTADSANHRITDDALGEGTTSEKLQRNLQALRILKDLEGAGRAATPEEQEQLSRYIGWGGLPQAFDETKTGMWKEAYDSLHVYLTDAEFASARASTLNAHFTSPTVIRAVYQGLKNLGFQRGNILEPGCGVGNFIGLLPESMQDSKVYGVEKDSITGRIAQQLYPHARIAVQGFEDTELPDSFFDAAVGNVPFGDYKLHDPKYNRHNFSIHEYFFAKALDKVRPGGVLALVTSKYLLDSKDSSTRRYLAQRADLIGAIRLPNTAFKANAGTEVTTDILFLQKRDRPSIDEPSWLHVSETEDGVPANSYFVENPHMLTGTMQFWRNMYGKENETALVETEGADWKEKLHEAVSYIHGEIPEPMLDDVADAAQSDERIPADPHVRDYSYTLHENRVYYRINSLMSPADVNKTAESRIRDMLAVRDAAREVIDQQLRDVPDAAIQQTQGQLTTLYDRFFARHGSINSRANRLAFGDDASYPLLCSLELLDEKGEVAGKADIFTKRTIRKPQPVTSVDTSEEALAVSLSERGCVDVGFMASLRGSTPDAVIAELSGKIFKDHHSAPDEPHSGYITAEEYLSGYVRRKLIEAREVAEQHPDVFAHNVAALEASQPIGLDAADISVRIGAVWIPTEDVENFICELLEASNNDRRNLSVVYSKATTEWNINSKSLIRNVKALSEFGTERANALRLIEDCLNLRDTRIYDLVYIDGKETRKLNYRETMLAQVRQESIRNAFAEWIFHDPDRRGRLVRHYNDHYNNITPRVYDGSFLTFPGMNPEIKLVKHQSDVAARQIFGGNTLLAHVVGAGKTYAMIAAAMEKRRLGLCNKPMFVVPNYLTEQWAAEIMRLYPAANVLTTTMKDFEKSNRKRFCSRIATGDFDAVIIGHSQFQRIQISKERQIALMGEQIDEIMFSISRLKEANAENFTIKQMEKTRKSLEAKLKSLTDDPKDDAITFEELGVDMLFVDESHNYKNLFLTTKMRNIAGINTSESQKAFDMFLKCRYIDELSGGKGVVFASGTPVSNSMTELYTVQRYLQYGALEEAGVQGFDEWASIFGETVTSFELKPEGTGYRPRTRFAKFHNLPELMSMYRQVADIQTAEMLKLPVPKLKGGGEINISVEPDVFQLLFIADLAKRAERVRSGSVDAKEDNMLSITNDGRKVALDPRLIDPAAEDNPSSKVNTCIANVHRIWEEGREERLTQLVFCDLSTPKPNVVPMKEVHEDVYLVDWEQYKFTDVYNDVRYKLLDMGVPANEIAFIHDAKTDAQRAELFAKIIRGDVRVLLGSTAKMGAGMNVQYLLKAVHDLDVPWRPADLEQRHGRILRRHNKNEEVEIYRYVTERTFDAYSYQLLENKQRFISQVSRGDAVTRTADDIDASALSFAEVKALAAGDPRIKEKMDLDVQVDRLRLLRTSHAQGRYRLESALKTQFPAEIERLSKLIPRIEKDVELAANSAQAEFSIRLGASVYADKQVAGLRFDEMRLLLNKDTASVDLGAYRGFGLSLEHESFGTQALRVAGSSTYSIPLGESGTGAFTRLDNALKGLPTVLDERRSALEAVHANVRQAEAELAKPFAQEQEYKEKSALLAELSIALSLGETHAEVSSEQGEDDVMELTEKPPDRDR